MSGGQYYFLRNLKKNECTTERGRCSYLALAADAEDKDVKMQDKSKGKPAVIVYLSPWFQKTAELVDKEFLTDETGGRKYLVVHLKKIGVTLFCPLHTIKVMSQEDWNSFNKGLLFIETRKNGLGYLDFRKSFAADWKGDFFTISEEFYSWERTHRKKIYELAEARTLQRLGHDPRNDVSPCLYEKIVRKSSKK